MLHLSLMDSTGTKQLNFFWRFIIHYFRFHFTPEKGDNRNKPAKMAALSLHAWMVKHGIDNTVLVLGVTQQMKILVGKVNVFYCPFLT